MTSYARPEAGDLKTGMPVFVVRSHNDMRGRKGSDKYIPAVITAAARVWLTVKAEGSTREWRMRRDTMGEATQYSGNNAQLVTPEQKRWEVRQAAAFAYLREQGITIERGSPWYGREQQLAELLKGA